MLRNPARPVVWRIGAPSPYVRCSTSLIGSSLLISGSHGSRRVRMLSQQRSDLQCRRVDRGRDRDASAVRTPRRPMRSSSDRGWVASFFELHALDRVGRFALLLVRSSCARRVTGDRLFGPTRTCPLIVGSGDEENAAQRWRSLKQDWREFVEDPRPCFFAVLNVSRGTRVNGVCWPLMVRSAQALASSLNRGSFGTWNIDELRDRGRESS